LPALPSADCLQAPNTVQFWYTLENAMRLTSDAFSDGQPIPGESAFAVMAGHVLASASLTVRYTLNPAVAY